MKIYDITPWCFLMIYNMKQRFFFFGFFNFLWINFLCFLKGFYLLSSYQKYNSVVVYSTWSIYTILFPLFHAVCINVNPSIHSKEKRF